MTFTVDVTSNEVYHFWVRFYDMKVLQRWNFFLNVYVFSFQVTAKNHDLESERSEAATVKLTYIEPVNSLAAESTAEGTVTLSWKPVSSVEGYNVRPSLERPYPNLPDVNTTSTKITGIGFV